MQICIRKTENVQIGCPECLVQIRWLEDIESWRRHRENVGILKCNRTVEVPNRRSITGPSPRKCQGGIDNVDCCQVWRAIGIEYILFERLVKVQTGLDVLIDARLEQGHVDGTIRNEVIVCIVASIELELVTVVRSAGIISRLCRCLTVRIGSYAVKPPCGNIRNIGRRWHGYNRRIERRLVIGSRVIFEIRKATASGNFQFEKGERLVTRQVNLPNVGLCCRLLLLHGSRQIQGHDCVVAVRFRIAGC